MSDKKSKDVDFADEMGETKFFRDILGFGDKPKPKPKKKKKPYETVSGMMSRKYGNGKKRKKDD